MSRRYLVTGGCGALGAPLVRALVGKGHRVRVLDDSSRGSASRLADLQGRCELVAGDVRDPKAVRRAVRGVDSVCHLAFVNGTEHFYQRPAYVLDVGVKGMLNVLDACIAAGVKELILASSSEVYHRPPSIPADESAPLVIPDPHNPRYSYAGGKIISELMVLHYGKAYFDRVLIFRPHNVYGPDMGWEHVIPQLTRRMVEAKAQTGEATITLPIQGDGSHTRAFIYVEDFIAALMLVMEQGAHLNIYHIGTMDEVAIRDVAERIGQCLGVGVRLTPGPDAEGGTPHRCPDTRKLQALGFRPGITFDEGLRRTVEWYARHVPPQGGRAAPALSEPSMTTRG